ncbi:MAG: hypothetical protein JW936_08425, partial [Sedimentisphaerales bacterium]|nr:hypothetical protein [Sedimentisphaerales bacterium]
MLYKEAVRRLYVQILIIIGICAYANAESLYVVRHGADTTNNLLVFEIVDNELVFQAQQTITTAGYGGIDLAIDNENNVVFVSNESSSVLTLVNAKTLDEITTVTLSGPTDLTGIVYDPTQQKLYGTERNTNELYSYSWNAQTNAMTPDPCNPFELDGGIDYACGLSLNGSILYVSDYYYLIGQQNAPRSSLVYKYDVTDEFSYQGTIDMDDGIVSIVHDSYENAMYAGAYGGTNDTYIIKHDLDLGSPIQKDIGTNAIGIETNDNTGLLYVTTYRYDPCSFSSGGVEVYDTSSWTSDPNQVVTYEDIYNSTNDDDVTISNLAGLVIGGPYKPEIMGVTITPDPCTCIYPADQGDPCYIEYTICYSGGGQGDQTNTWLTAHLPNELYPTDPCDEHFFLTEYAFIWNLTTVAEDANNCVSFEAYVLPGAEPLGSFTLEVELESDTSYTTETITTNICCWGGDTIYVNQNVSDEELHTGISWQNAYANLQDAINRADQGCGNEIWVAKGTYIPTEE